MDNFEHIEYFGSNYHLDTEYPSSILLLADSNRLIGAYGTSIIQEDGTERINSLAFYKNSCTWEVFREDRNLFFAILLRIFVSGLIIGTICICALMIYNYMKGRGNAGGQKMMDLVQLPGTKEEEGKRSSR